MNNGISPKAPAKEKIKSDFECLIRGMNGTGMINCIAYDYLFDGAMPMFNKMYELGKKEATTWHPYPEDVPDMDKGYLVTIQNKIGQFYTTMDFWDKEGFVYRDKNVLAWAELPEPYRPEVNDE